MTATLIDRLRDATEPSRELDVEFHEFINPRLGGVVAPEFVPRYTGSIDAAISTVPKGITSWFMNMDSGICAVICSQEGASGTGTAHLPACAILAAALKMRENDE